MQKTDYETWQEIGEQAKRAETELHELADLLSGNIPKTVYADQFDRANDALTKLRSDLEGRLSQEHPDDWEISDFYKTSEVTPYRKMDDE